jgi:hypothetical protein
MLIPRVSVLSYEHVRQFFLLLKGAVPNAGMETLVLSGPHGISTSAILVPRCTVRYKTANTFFNTANLSVDLHKPKHTYLLDIATKYIT